MNTIIVNLPTGDKVQITLSVEVLPGASVPTSLLDTSPITLTHGETTKRKLDVLDQYGNPMPTPADNLWSVSASSSIVSVSVVNGFLEVVGVSPGQATITLSV